MKLKSLWINGYKNLLDTTIDFEACSIPIAIIGNNGTGKSNLIEALLHIFMGLYYDNAPDFDYEIEYIAHGKSVKASKLEGQETNSIIVDNIKWSRTRFKTRVRDTNRRPPFPALVFGYYSGTCERLKDLLKKYERTFASKLKNYATDLKRSKSESKIISDDLQRNFVFSDIAQAKKILVSLVAHKHTGLLAKIDVADIERLKIIVQPPKNYSDESSDIILWDTKGAIRYFLSALENYSDESNEKRKDVNEKVVVDNRRYDFLLSDNKRKEQFHEMAFNELKKNGTNLYSMLQALETNGMLVEIDFSIISKSKKKSFPFDALSEGEKQLLCVIGGLTMAHHKECLVLLDEPDTHLNPTWSWEYNKLLKNSLHSEQLQDSTVLIATHDPVLISGLTREQVLIAKNENGILSYDHPHRNPRGQGVANLLTSEFFGLPSSLDLETQEMMDERLKLAYKSGALTIDEKNRLKKLNVYLDELSLTISERDEDYKDFLKQKYQGR
jgi:predicted ATP-dependent endonuclease of OLD family